MSRRLTKKHENGAIMTDVFFGCTNCNSEKFNNIMDVQIVLRTEKDFILQIKIPYCKTMLEFDEMLHEKLNALESVITGETLKQFDKKFDKNYRIRAESKKGTFFL
ncbi:MAG: hypothetical protein ACK41Q_04325 [Candidatus Brocadia sp.]